MEEDKRKTLVMEELRKTFPRAGLKWTEEEDVTLKNFYNLHGKTEAGNFENFLQNLSSQFGRKPNGIRGRLAKYFPDIPGWNYEGMEERDRQRAEARKLEKENSAPSIKVDVDSAHKEPVFKLDLSGNSEGLEALRVLQETGSNLFLTGEAGTGKSTLLQYFRKTTKECGGFGSYGRSGFKRGRADYPFFLFFWAGYHPTKGQKTWHLGRQEKTS